jgi:hypothetical protein
LDVITLKKIQKNSMKKQFQGAIIVLATANAGVWSSGLMPAPA